MKQRVDWRERTDWVREVRQQRGKVSGDLTRRVKETDAENWPVVDLARNERLGWDSAQRE